MRRPNKKKYTIIALIIVGVMILSPVLSLVISAMAPSTVERDITKQIDDETALKIIDIYRNLNEYIGKELSMELHFVSLEGSEEYKDIFSLGVTATLDNGEEKFFELLAQTEDGSIPEGLEDFDKVQVTGSIKDSFEETHEDHGHTTNVPIMTVKSIEKIENQDN
ncbi:hypothetical protein GOQ27_11780 [Clostridium sp. D2Q-11]|uniref:Uncharacterized protein n=1 Tax=Anaeromonas frigoriresistens TaxID=2683708 RepID=A0A942UZH2_9FIRM|nr:hypothetical protein [Anaeromonas frigoriresistens]MBS4539146.1 hypothetical protein [Anaeromonas frigoriresistens]